MSSGRQLVAQFSERDAQMQEEDYTPQSPTVTVLRPSPSAGFHLAEQALARGASYVARSS